MRRYTKWVLVPLVLLLCLSAGATAGTVTNAVSGTLDTWISVAADTAFNAGAISAAINPTNPSYRKCDCILEVNTFAAAPAVNGNVVGWLVRSLDANVTYEDGSATVFPARAPDLVFPLRNVATAQKVTFTGLDLPRQYGGVASFKLVIRNTAGTGATMNGSTGGVPWTVKCRTYTEQVN